MSKKQVPCVNGELVSLLGWSSLLKDGDVQVLAATGEEEALTMFKREEISLVVITAVHDASMVHEMKSFKPKVPIVLFLAAHGDGLSLIDAVVKEPTKLLGTVRDFVMQ
jgi:hypothetical protein